MEIKKSSSVNIHDIASLHFDGISTGFISSLGLGFVAALYEAINNDKNSFCLAAQEGDEVFGFAAFTEDLGSLYKSAIKSNGLKLVLAVGLKMLKPAVIKRIMQNLFYPSKTEKLDLPKAELLSIAISPQARGKGLGIQLCEAGFEECRRRGMQKVKVLVAADNQPANKLYQKVGFEFVTSIDSHGVKSNVYVKLL